MQSVNEFHKRTVRAAECSSWRETEYHLEVCLAPDSAHVEIYQAHKKFGDV
jgi:hypothetical protein